MIDIPCVIFAGGKSSRMGEDKALLPFAGFNTLTEYQYTRLSKIFTKVYISCKDKSKFNFIANFIKDDKEPVTFAPTLGFISTFSTIIEEKFFAISVDIPFVTEKEIQKIVLANDNFHDAIIAKTDEGVQPLCGIYSKNLKNDFMQMLKDKKHKLGFLLQKSKTTYVYFPDTKPFLNMNHPQDYKKALEVISHY